MRTPTQQTLDTFIPPFPTDTKNGGFSHAHLNNDGLARTAWLLRKAAY